MLMRPIALAKVRLPAIPMRTMSTTAVHARAMSARAQAQIHPVDCLSDAEQRETRQARPFRVDKGEEQVGERRGKKTRHDDVRVRVARPTAIAAKEVQGHGGTRYHRHVHADVGKAPEREGLANLYEQQEHDLNHEIGSYNSLLV